MPEYLTSQDFLYFFTMVTGRCVSNSSPLKVLSRCERHTNIFVGKLVRETHSLRLVPDGFSVHDGVFEVIDNRLVDGMTLPCH
jgi:hypothetical protein